MTITDASGNPMGGEVPEVAQAKAVGNTLLVELLTAQEMLNTNLHISDDEVQGNAHQGYILDIGPMVDCEKYGFEVGDRFILSGGAVPCPESLGNHRRQVIVDPHSIKAVLVEDK